MEIVCMVLIDDVVLASWVSSGQELAPLLLIKAPVAWMIVRSGRKMRGARSLSLV
jgi:hypothetical protein